MINHTIHDTSIHISTHPCTRQVDNSGPHTYAEATIIADAISLLFPGAKVVASDAIDDFVAAVLPHKHTLPVVTAEIGDTWIMGANADPLKVGSRDWGEGVGRGARVEYLALR